MFQYFPIPELAKAVLTSLVGVLTLIGIMTRPFRWNEAMIAIGGAAVLLLLGLISPADAFLTLVRDWNTFLFFLGMMMLSALAEAASLFDWLAVQAARLAGRSAARLFLNVFLLGSLISMILSNDATALILTPIVYLFPAAGQQSDQCHHYFAVPTRPMDLCASPVSTKPGGDWF